MRRTVVVTLMLLAAGCDQGNPSEQPPSPPSPSPVADSSPYLCDLVPEQSFRQVIGFTAPLNVHWSGPQTDNGLCLVRAAGREAPLGLTWSYNSGERILKIQQDSWEGKPTQPLPKDLGRGFAVVADITTRPNYVIALFGCGKRRPYISIDFAPVVRGRDAVEDMIAFMRIAEKRFGQIHKCTPKPA